MQRGPRDQDPLSQDPRHPRSLPDPGPTGPGPTRGLSGTHPVLDLLPGPPAPPTAPLGSPGDPRTLPGPQHSPNKPPGPPAVPTKTPTAAGNNPARPGSPGRPRRPSGPRFLPGLYDPNFQISRAHPRIHRPAPDRLRSLRLPPGRRKPLRKARSPPEVPGAPARHPETTGTDPITHQPTGSTTGLPLEPPGLPSHPRAKKRATNPPGPTPRAPSAPRTYSPGQIHLPAQNPKIRPPRNLWGREDPRFQAWRPYTEIRVKGSPEEIKRALAALYRVPRDPTEGYRDP